ncbi:hypothetical protein Tco_0963442 [Tanacetum coccineum]
MIHNSVVTTAPSIPAVDIEVNAASLVSTALVFNTSIPTTSTIVSTVITPEEVDLTQEITLAQALATLNNAKPKEKDVVAKTSVGTATTMARDKGKGIMVEPEKPLKPKDQIKADEQLTRELEAEEEEVVRLKREEAQRQEQANIDLLNSCDNIQAMIEADQLLAKRIQAREKE